MRALPNRLRAVIDWSQDDTANVEDALSERAGDRAQERFAKNCLSQNKKGPHIAVRAFFVVV